MATFRPRNESSMLVNTDTCVEILERISLLKDKLAFASVCRASREALRDERSWQDLEVSQAACSAGDHATCDPAFQHPMIKAHTCRDILLIP